MFGVSFWLARRFFLTREGDRFLSFIAWIAMGGIALGVAALSIVMSVVNGFEGELVRAITSLHGHVFVHSRAEPFRDPQELRAALIQQVPDLSEIRSAFSVQLMLSAGSSVRGAMLTGLDFAESRPLVEQLLVRGKVPEHPDEVVMGQALFERLHLELGQKIGLMIPLADHKMDLPGLRDVRVVGVVNLGMYDFDAKFVMGRIEMVQAFVGFPGAVTQFHITLRDASKANVTANRLQEHFGGSFRVRDWTQMNRNLFYAIKLEKAVIAVLLAVIILVAAFNIVSTLMMMIQDKSREFSILKAMGMRQSVLQNMLLGLGVGFGLLGSVMGLAIGLFVLWVLSWTQWIRLPADIYFISFLPVEPRLEELFGIMLLAVLLAGLAAWGPARTLAQRSPLEGIRHD